MFDLPHLFYSYRFGADAVPVCCTYSLYSRGFILVGLGRDVTLRNLTPREGFFPWTPPNSFHELVLANLGTIVNLTRCELGPLLLTWISLIQGWISHQQYVRWNYLSIPKLQRLHRWSLEIDKFFLPTLNRGCNYLSLLGFKLNNVRKQGPGGWELTSFLSPFEHHLIDNQHLYKHINTLRPRQNGRHFADDIFKCIFMNQNVWIPIKISLKFVPKSPINDIPALVQIMTWRRPGDKPLSEPMLVS